MSAVQTVNTVIGPDSLRGLLFDAYRFIRVLFEGFYFYYYYFRSPEKELTV